MAGRTRGACENSRQTAAGSGLRRGLEETTTRSAPTTRQRVVRAHFARCCSDLSAIQLPAQRHPLRSTTSAGEKTGSTSPRSQRARHIAGDRKEGGSRARQGPSEVPEHAQPAAADSDRRRQRGGPANALFWFSRMSL